MNMTETIIGVAILFIVISQMVSLNQEVQETTDARTASAMVAALHRSGDQYLRAEYPRLVACLDTSPDPVPGERQAAPEVVSVPLFQPDPGMTAADLVNLLGSGCPGFAPDSISPRPFADVGVLPPGLDALRYDSANPESELWSGDNLRFRFLVRQVGFGGGESGIQGFLVVSTPDDIPQSERYTRDLMRYAGIPEAGIIVSNDPLDSSASGRVVRGYGGGWELEVCDHGGGATGFASCVSSDRTSSAVLDLDTVVQSDTVISAFRADVAGSHTPAGGRPGLDTPTARLVAVNTLRRETALRNVLYRTDIGVPGANRMQAPLDMGGFGFFNAAFVMGPDTNSDGEVDSGLQLIGPPAGGADPAEHPTRVFGDLVVTGNLVVGGTEVPDRAHAQGGTIIAVRQALGPAGSAYPFVDHATNPPSPATGVGMLVGHNIQVGDGDGGEVTLSQALAAPNVQGRVWLQGLQAGQADYQVAMHGTDTQGAVHASNVQVGHATFDPNVGQPAATDGVMYVRRSQTGQETVGTPLFDTGLAVEAAEGRGWVQALQAGQGAYQAAMHGPDTDGSVHVRNLQAGHAVFDPNVAQPAATDGVMYVRRAQTGQETAGTPKFDTGLAVEAAEGRGWVQALQAGQGAYQAAMHGPDTDGSVHVRNLQAGHAAFDPNVAQPAATDGVVFARRAQLGQPALDTELTEADGSLWTQRAQVGQPAYDTGVNAKPGTLYASRAQVGHNFYDATLDPADGAIMAKKVQVSRWKQFSAQLALPGADGSIWTARAQAGLPDYDPHLNGADGRVYMRTAQVGRAVFDAGLKNAGAVGVVLADKVQVGRGAYDAGLNTSGATGVVLADKAQVGRAAYDGGLDNADAKGIVLADKVQVGHGGYDAGLNASGATGVVLADKAQIGRDGYDAGLNHSGAKGAVLAGKAQLGHGPYLGWLNVSPRNHGTLLADRAQLGTEIGYDNTQSYAVSPAALLVRGDSGFGGSVAVRGAKFHARLDSDPTGSASSWHAVRNTARQGVELQKFAVTGGTGYTPSPGATAFVGFGGGHTDGSVEIQTLHSETKLGTNAGRFREQYPLGSIIPTVAIEQHDAFTRYSRNDAVAPPPPCPESGITRERLAIPHSWRTSELPFEYNVRLTMNIPPHGSGSVDLGPFRDPYVGWSSSPLNGKSNAQGSASESQDSTVASLLTLCDHG